MPNLTEQLSASLGAVDISATIDGQVLNIGNIATTLAGLVDNPPDEFGDYLQLLEEFEPPQFSAGTDLAATFDSIGKLIPADLSDLNGELLGSLDQLHATALSGVDGVLQPFIERVNGIRTLLQGDIFCGLFPAFWGAAGDTAEAPPAEPPPPPAPLPPGQPNPGPQTETVSQTQIDAARAAVDLLPSPLTVANLLPWLAEFWGRNPVPYNILRAVPLLDDIRGPVTTLAHWQTLNGGELIDQFSATLNRVAQVVEHNSSEFLSSRATQLEVALGDLDINALDSATTAIISHFANLQSAVQSGELSAIGPDISGVQTALASLNTQHNAWNGALRLQLDRIAVELPQLPDMLEEQMARLVSLLQAPPSFADLLPDIGRAIPVSTGADENAIDELFDRLQAFLDPLLDALDLSLVLQPISEPFAQATGLVDEINQQLSTMTLDISDRLSQLNSVIDGIDLTVLIADVQQTLNDYVGQLQAQLASQFAPVKAALENLVTQIDAAADSFDPQAIRDAIETVIASVSAIFNSPEVQQVLALFEQLRQLADSLQSLSFTPLTDTVISGITEVKSALDSIDDSNLDPPLPDMIDSAMSVLPGDIRPLTDPLIDRLGELIEAGPIELLEQIKHIPAQVLDEVRNYGPEQLLGDSLSAPFEEIISHAEQFDPQNLFDTIAQGFESLKQQLKDSANPGDALRPIVQLHRQLGLQLAQLNPGDLLQPLDEKIQSVTTLLSDNIDINRILQPLADVIEQINRHADFLDKGSELVNHLLGKLDDLSDAPAQLESWIDSLFDKLPDGADITPLDSALQSLATAIGNTQRANLQVQLQAMFATSSSSLGNFNPGQRLSSLVQSVRSVSSSAVNALPDSAEKTQLLALLDSIDLTAGSVTGPLNQLARVNNALVFMAADFELRFNAWDDEFHAPGSALAELGQTGLSLADIKARLRDAILRQLSRPLAAILGKVALFRNMLQQLLGVLGNLLDELDNRIAELLAAPQALLDLGASAQNLIDTIAGINLDFLQDSINESFASVRDKFSALDPAQLQNTLNEAFDEVIDSIDLDLIVPTDSLDHLGTAFNQLLQKLRGLNPQTVLVEPLQQAFEETLEPFIEALDVTAVLEAIIARLEPMEDELRGEMDRVNSAYQDMLAAAP